MYVFSVLFDRAFGIAVRQRKRGLTVKEFYLGWIIILKMVLK